MTSSLPGRLRKSLAVLGALLLQCLTQVHAGGEAPAPLRRSRRKRPGSHRSDWTRFTAASKARSLPADTPAASC